MLWVQWLNCDIPKSITLQVFLFVDETKKYVLDTKSTYYM